MNHHVTAPAVIDEETRRLVDRFENGALDPETFRHREHVRVAWGMLRAGGLADTVARFPQALRRFTARHGVSQRYHETLTWAFLLLVHQRMAELGEGHQWPDFVASSDDLLRDHRETLRRHYPGEQLDSDLARQVFVLPLAATAAGES